MGWNSTACGPSSTPTATTRVKGRIIGTSGAAYNDADMQLTDLFSLSFEGRRDVVGLEYENADGHVQEFTFGEMDARAERMAIALDARGLKAGDRLLVQLPNSVEFLDIFLACLRLVVIFEIVRA